MNMGQRHKHADVIIAWAEGKDVQVRAPLVGEWRDLSIEVPNYYEEWEYRVKPPTKKYRVALFKNAINGDSYTSTCDSPNDSSLYETHSNFVRWLTDWVEYEE